MNIVTKLTQLIGAGFLYASLSFPAQANPELWTTLTSMAAHDWDSSEQLSSQQMSKLQQLAKTGDANAQFALGKILMVNHDHQAAGEWLQRAAEQGHMPAKYAFAGNARLHDAVASIN